VIQKARDGWIPTGLIGEAMTDKLYLIKIIEEAH